MNSRQAQVHSSREPQQHILTTLLHHETHQIALVLWLLGSFSLLQRFGVGSVRVQSFDFLLSVFY